jgi:hypothetical protein
MGSTATYGLARRVAKIYVLTDFLLGPVLVGAAFLGWALFIFGVAAAWHLGVPWPLAMAFVGIAWAAIILGSRRFARWVLTLMRAPRPASSG